MRMTSAGIALIALVAWGCPAAPPQPGASAAPKATVAPKSTAKPVAEPACEEFVKADADKDGFLSSKEFGTTRLATAADGPTGPEQEAAALKARDGNADGKLSAAEFCGKATGPTDTHSPSAAPSAGSASPAVLDGRFSATFKVLAGGNAHLTPDFLATSFRAGFTGNGARGNAVAECREQGPAGYRVVWVSFQGKYPEPGTYPVKSTIDFKCFVLFSELPDRMPQPGTDPTWVSSFGDPEEGTVVVKQMTDKRWAFEVKGAKLVPHPATPAATGSFTVDGEGECPVEYNIKI